MANIFRVIGRVAGKAVASRPVDRAVTVVSDYVVTGAKLTDLHALRTMLRRKRSSHLGILGRCAYRLDRNGVAVSSEGRIDDIVRIVEEIDGEIARVDAQITQQSEEARIRRDERARKARERDTVTIDEGESRE